MLCALLPKLPLLRPRLALLTSLLLATVAQAAPIYSYSEGHGDFRVRFNEDTLTFTPIIRLDSGAEYEADEVKILVSTTRTVTSAGFTNLLGVASGSMIYVAGSSWAEPNLGFSAEGLNESDWYQTFPYPGWPEPVTFPVISVELTDWSGPAGSQVGLYRTNNFNSMLEAAMSTYDASQTPLGENLIYLQVDDHQHFAFGFTHDGIYELELTFSGLYQNEHIVTGTSRFVFHVVPEPSLAILLPVGAVVVFLIKRRSAAAA